MMEMRVAAVEGGVLTVVVEGDDDVDFMEMMVRVMRQMVVRVTGGCNGRGRVAGIRPERWCYAGKVREHVVRSTETFDGLAAIQARQNNLGREIKKVNEKVYAAQVGCEQCKGPYYTKDCPLKEEGKTLEEAYYT
ncbi:hypothetical protein Tco_1405386 [Tanacetum coccineum]